MESAYRAQFLVMWQRSHTKQISITFRKNQISMRVLNCIISKFSRKKITSWLISKSHFGSLKISLQFDPELISIRLPRSSHCHDITLEWDFEPFRDEVPRASRLKSHQNDSLRFHFWTIKKFFHADEIFGRFNFYLLLSDSASILKQGLDRPHTWGSITLSCSLIERVSRKMMKSSKCPE